MKFFLRLKHWQLFILLMAAPVIFQVITIESVFTRNPTATILYFLLMMLAIIIIFFGWFYSLGTNLYQKLPSATNMNLKLFKLFLFIPLAYLISLCAFIFSISLNMSARGLFNPVIRIFVVLVHLFSMFCIFYCLHFIAKALKTAETQKPVTLNEFTGEFFLLWFFPIGVWLIQPRINKLFNDSDQLGQ